MTQRGLPLGQDVLRRTRTRSGVDGDGNDIWTDVDDTLRGVAVWPRYSTEIEGGRDTVIIGLGMLVPSDTVIKATDRFLVGGSMYQIEGEPGHWRSPFTGRRPGVEVALRRVVG